MEELKDFQKEWSKNAITRHTLSIKGINLRHECYSGNNEDVIIIKGTLLGVSNFPEEENEKKEKK